MSGSAGATAERLAQVRFKDWSLTAWVAGFLAVLIAYAGPLVIFIQAAQVGRVSPAELTSWIWAISMGAGTVSYTHLTLPTTPYV